MIIDAHCDALYKMWEDSSLSFQTSSELRVNYLKWMNSSVKVQCFAIYVPEYVPSDCQFQAALEMVDLFYERIVNPNETIKIITCQKDIENLKPHERGAMLTLEGCHPIGEDLIKLKTLIRLGVRSVGLTWNQANAVSDGIKEQRGAGLSDFGKRVVQFLNKEQIWVDVSHLSYQGFWDVMKVATYPMASHSNALSITPHPRNLDDKQIVSLINKRAFIGVTFVLDFLTSESEATIEDVVSHIEHIISLGGENSIGLGSDFDGTSSIVQDLSDLNEYENLVNKLKEMYTIEQVDQILYENFLQCFPRKD